MMNLRVRDFHLRDTDICVRDHPADVGYTYTRPMFDINISCHDIQLLHNKPSLGAL